MIIRHDIDPALYLVDPTQFPAVVPVDSFQEKVLVIYDPIDQLLKPSLIPSVPSEPEFYTRYDGMGTLIRPDWILSAAHVAAELTVEREIEFTNATHRIQQIVLHPQFKNFKNTDNPLSLEKFADHDIGLIQLTQPVTDISPLPLYRHKNELKKIVTLMGRGDYGNGLMGPIQVDGNMRKATNCIEVVNQQWLMFKFDAPPAGTDLEGISGPGDSGGPALLMTAEGWAVAGVSSGQDSSPAGVSIGEGYYGVWEYYTRVSGYVDWIESVVESGG